ncbi:DUF2795 domain-containing protein [Gordonia sp. PKS22-38]|uniref:DUF2795 domain-containing protein n=1 Tax=Gordonia prachuapensis TaxID=3115651 RepID=A0ABU7MY98_9ACTN|nr:DUF2795 domain-containing protein [Gordonia sp. PKS22-38]
MTTTTRTRVLKEALDAVDYPADKEQLLAEAERAGAGPHTIRALRSIPLETYQNFAEVSAAVPVDDTTAEQSASDKAQQHRHHTMDGLAAGEREVPVNPIVDELGENRGS